MRVAPGEAHEFSHQYPSMSSRRHFIRSASGIAALGLIDLRDATLRRVTQSRSVHESFPRSDPVAVESLVRVAHTDIAEVRRMIERQPSLARASWDWGFGDWETGLGAAAHSGKRDIAELLLAHGARPTIFSAAMFGHVDVVRAFVAAQPGVQRTLGPHGLTLLAHARAGGTDAAPVLSFLQGLGDADRRPASVALASSHHAALEGRYAFGAGTRDYFDVDVRMDQLGLQRPQTNRRFLIHTGDFAFFPSGVPSVRIVFRVEGARATHLTIADPGVIVTAQRVG